jgi:hypothetical protein
VPPGRQDGHGIKHAYRTLVGKPERKRPLGRPSCKWEDNTKMDLGEIEWSGMDYYFHHKHINLSI